MTKPAGGAMSNELMLYGFEGTEVRIATRSDGEIFVCLRDLLQTMGTTRDASKVLPEIVETFGDGATISLPIVDALGRV